MLQRQIELLTFTDPLTGLLNRRGLIRALKSHWEIGRRNNSDLALAILDLDHFKEINDRFGHGVGDEVLVGFSHRLRDIIRSTDVVARWGGEEFLLLMPETDVAEGLLVTERVRGAVAASPLAAGASTITVSIGMAARRLITATGYEDLIAVAGHPALHRQESSKLRRGQWLTVKCSASGVARFERGVLRPTAPSCARTGRPCLRSRCRAGRAA